ncbi:MAG: PQQ-binding-like beta-propeller repeat protein [Planctomycetota bacterium]
MRFTERNTLVDPRRARPGWCLTSLVLATLFWNCAWSADADPWPEWRGSKRDGISRETGLLQEWPKEGPKVLWSAPIGEGYSCFSVVDGRLYTMAQEGPKETILCFDATTGKEIWKCAYDSEFKCEEGNGPRGTPTVDEDRIYAVGGNNVFHCVDAKTGEARWKKDLLAEFNAPNMPWGTSTSPLIDGDLVYVIPGGPEGNSIAAFDKRTGELKWKNLDDRAGYSSPLRMDMAGRPIILFFNAVALIGSDPATGKELFRYPWETQYRCNIATPIHFQGKVFISSGYDQGCALVRISTKGDEVSCEQVYRNKEMKNHFSTCVLHEGKLYGFDMAFLTCLDFETGKQEWKQRGFGRGSLTLADGKLIILGENGKLALARPDGTKYDEISSVKAFDGRCWTMPVVADGRLYLRGPTELVCRSIIP